MRGLVPTVDADYESAAPDHYDPAAGLRRVAVAEAAARHFARAKDARRLHAAIAAKLTAQRRFVLWWDGQAKRRATFAASGVTDGVAAADFGLSRDTIHRWRKRLKAPDRFAAALAAAQARCVKVCEARQGQSDHARATCTGETEWYTPPEILAAARDVLGAIDLDPASSPAAQRRVRARRYFTAAEDGLARRWHGRVWLNPPYAQPHIARFVAKLVAELAAGRVAAAILLTHNYTDTAWFHQAAGAARAVCFTRGRVRFLDPAGQPASPTQGQALFYFAAPETAGGAAGGADAFARRFAAVGLVVRPL